VAMRSDWVACDPCCSGARYPSKHH